MIEVDGCLTASIMGSDYGRDQDIRGGVGRH
jgi:hypothetical protein